MDFVIDFFKNLWESTGIRQFFIDGGWKNLVMILLALVLLFLAIKKKFEPYLLLPIAFGMLLVNLPGVGKHLFSVDENFHPTEEPGLLGYLYYGIDYEIYPCLIFLCIGATTDFGPLIANKKTMLLGAAAQIGIFVTFLGALALGFTGKEAAAIGIIGGADGPTAILVTTKLAKGLLGPITIAAYSYMALVPVIQPPIMKLLTTKKERAIKMEQLRPVSKKEKILFPVIVATVTILIVPSCAPLIGCLMLGNLIKESGVVPKITDALANSLMYIVTILIGLCVGATASGDTFLSVNTLKIFALGIIAFSIATAFGVLAGKVMCVATKGKVNPLIGAAGVSAVPMAARVVNKVGRDEDPSNFLLMHAMGPNVAGVIGSAVAAGIFLMLAGII
ncbi:MAG: sodium ion-translocating decarboxylase subunit beta [Mollicutes bacterium]|nr:sodium ion-translocating decarboxylase subunit beta [Mollicutes bacterium]